MDEQQIRERLAKIKRLFEGTQSAGEKAAAGAAMERLQLRIGIDPQQPVTEWRFRLGNTWSTRLFIALCRSKGLKPYRRFRMRSTSMCVMTTRTRVHGEIWPEFVEMDQVLTQYLTELADHIITECIDPDRSDATTIAGLPEPAAVDEIGS